MQSIPCRPRKVAYHLGLVLLGLTSVLCAADARPMLLPSEEFPGPWFEVTQEIRDILALNKVSACSQAAGRESSRNPGEYLLVLHVGRKGLDRLACKTGGARRSRPGQAPSGYRAAGRVLEPRQACAASTTGP